MHFIVYATNGMEALFQRGLYIEKDHKEWTNYSAIAEASWCRSKNTFDILTSKYQTDKQVHSPPSC